MSNHKPDGPYVYQPFGMNERDHWKADRVYAVGGMDRLATVNGLTKDEATRIVAALRAPPSPALRREETCPTCGSLERDIEGTACWRDGVKNRDKWHDATPRRPETCPACGSESPRVRCCTLNHGDSPSTGCNRCRHAWHDDTPRAPETGEGA